MTDLCANDAVTLAGMLRRREVSAREVTAAHIERVEAVDGAVNAVVTRTFDAALAKAAAADDAIARGQVLGLLHGLPVAHKDLADTAGVRTTYGSPLFADHVPDRDTLVVKRMAQAGAISLGKTNTPEFGAGSHTVNPVFGATRNPYDLSRSAGGSSGGAAAALAARMICLADGSDLGGSLRNPASFCNVTGMRPTPGRVPRWPLVDVADTLGVEGPMGRTAADVALLLAALSGPDPGVPLALDAPAPDLPDPAAVTGLLRRDLQRLKVAWSEDLGLVTEPAVREALAPARQVLVDLGCEVIDASPDLSGADEAFRIWRAFRFAAQFGPLLRRELITPDSSLCDHAPILCDPAVSQHHKGPQESCSAGARPARAHQARFIGQHHKLHAVAGTEPEHHPGDMRLGRQRAYHQPLRDLVIGQARGDQRQHLCLAFGEGRQPAACGRPRLGVCRVLGDEPPGHAR